MSYTVANLKSEVVPMLHTTSASRITNFNGAIYRAARQVLQDVDPLETVRLIPMDAPITQNIYEYMCPADLKGDSVLDIRVTGNRNTADVYHQRYGEDFDRNKTLGQWESPFTIQWKNGVKTIRVNTPYGTAPAEINTLNSLTDNGTWSGTATNLVNDTVFFVASTASIRGTLPSYLTAAYIETSDMTAVDITEYLTIGNLYLYVFLGGASVITSVNIRLGTDSSNYYEYTATNTAEGTVFQNGWNLVRMPMESVVEVGSVTDTNVVYSRITFNYVSAADTTFRVNLMQIGLGISHELLYYSKYLFRDGTTGAFQEMVTSSDGTELINLDTDSYNLLVYQTALQCVQQTIPLNNQEDFAWIGQKYLETLERYKAKHPGPDFIDGPHFQLGA